MSASSSLNEKEKELEWRMQDQQVAAQQPKEYEPIVSEPLETAAVEKDIEANTTTRGNLSRFQSAASGVSEYSDELSSSTKSAKSKKKWYKNVNPLKWGPKPPVPEIREVSREYHAGLFSRLTFQWMSPIMTVSFFLRSILVVRSFVLNPQLIAGMPCAIGWIQATS